MADDVGRFLGLFYRLVRACSWPVFFLYFRLRSEGNAEVAPDGPLIVAANHVSFLDPAVLGSVFPRKIHFMMNAQVWSHPVLNWFFRGMQTVPVPRDGSSPRDALKHSLQCLRAGHVLGIFPEGGRVDVDAVGEALGGVALLARRSGAMVLPVGIAGTDEAMPRGRTIPDPVRIHVRFGETLSHSDFAAAEGLRGKEADERFAAAVMDRIRELTALAGSPGPSAVVTT